MKRALTILPMLVLLLLLAGRTQKGIEVRTGGGAGHSDDPEIPPSQFDREIVQPPNVAPQEAPVLGQTIQVWLDKHDWDSQPWVGGFRDRVWAYWKVPQAYKQGLLAGSTKMSVRIGRDGSLVSCEVTGENGQAALDEASLAVLKSAAPFAALPGDFPRDDLALTLGAIYLGTSAGRRPPAKS